MPTITVSHVLSLTLVWMFPGEASQRFERTAVYGERVRENLPELASALGLKVGWDTMDVVERQIGGGTPITSGHPQGARLWRWRDTGWLIHADGFEYRERTSGRGVVVDDLSLVAHHPEWAKLHPTNTTLTDSAAGRLWTSIVEDGSMRYAERRLRSRFGTPRNVNGSLEWRQSGFIRLNADSVIRRWNLRITQRAGRITGVYLSAVVSRDPS